MSRHAPARDGHTRRPSGPDHCHIERGRETPERPSATPARSPSRSDRRWAGLLGRPWLKFVHIEAAGGVVLLAATLLALAAANSPWGDQYLALWETEIGVSFGGWELHHDLRHWINHGLMTLFFFAAGLEIKRELVVGELSSIRAAALPMIAALGGVVAPALLYLALTPADAHRGWGVPVAADIAFVVGLLGLFGSRAPTALKAFVLSLAIADDIGAITIIALAYTDDLDLLALAGAGVTLLAIGGMRVAGIRVVGAYAVVGAIAWGFTEASAVHPTVAGVAIALIAPAVPYLDADASRIVAEELPASPRPADIRRSSRLLQESVSVADRLQDLVHPWTSYAIVPLFALANAAIPLDAAALRDAWNPITLGVAAGLAVGAPAGVYGCTVLALRSGRFRLPSGFDRSLLAPAAFLGGIGFTVALFIADLAFLDTARQAQARVGVLVGSTVAATVAAVLLARRLPAARGSGGEIDHPDALPGAEARQPVREGAPS